MSMEGILFYSWRALRFALLVSMGWLLLHLLRKKKTGAKWNWTQDSLQLLFVAYLAALLQITVIRGGMNWQASHSWETIQCVPLIGTISMLRYGLWDFIYPVVGNIIWFLPFGMMLSFLFANRFTRKKAMRMAFFLSLSIEAGQWFFGTGISDIDDVILNVAGAWLGFICAEKIKDGKQIKA